ncbi:MAG: hypothetical protein LBT05_02435, partial [Planctomycetaceae bacterium]|nr:hypothetical protein [Planctomycetaceae bacterium]
MKKPRDHNKISENQKEQNLKIYREERLKFYFLDKIKGISKNLFFRTGLTRFFILISPVNHVNPVKKIFQICLL